MSEKQKGVMVDGIFYAFTELRKYGENRVSVSKTGGTVGKMVLALLDHIEAQQGEQRAFVWGANWAFLECNLPMLQKGWDDATAEAAKRYHDSPASGPLTRDQFEDMYAAKSNTTVWELHRMGRFAYPCACEDADCKGWQMAHVQIQDENDAPAPYKAGCSSAVPLPEDGIIAFFENKYPRLEAAGLICGCGGIGCANCAPENF